MQPMAGEAPIRVYGVDLSYFTGKLEAYLRYKEIPYEFVPTPPGRLGEATGARQVPALELGDGRFMTDSTPIIAWFERERPDPPVIPTDPLQAFFSRLVEDYADEWLWRPAMHYRWSYAGDRALVEASRQNNIAAMLSNPRLNAALEDPEIQKLLSEIDLSKIEKK